LPHSHSLASSEWSHIVLTIRFLTYFYQSFDHRRTGVRRQVFKQVLASAGGSRRGRHERAPDEEEARLWVLLTQTWSRN
jgi:hypothetical protein